MTCRSALQRGGSCLQSASPAHPLFQISKSSHWISGRTRHSHVLKCPLTWSSAVLDLSQRRPQCILTQSLGSKVGEDEMIPILSDRVEITLFFTSKAILISLPYKRMPWNVIEVIYCTTPVHLRTRAAEHYKKIRCFPVLHLKAHCFVGLASGRVREGESPLSRMHCKLVFPGATEEAAREVLGGAELPALDLGISLEPSTAPAGIQLLWNSQEIPTQVPHPSTVSLSDSDFCSYTLPILASLSRAKGMTEIWME